MRDYTSNNYCDFLWISDILNLKRDINNGFSLKCQKNQKSYELKISLISVLGTIVEIKQVGFQEYLYQVDDGTGVLTCKHTEEQFESIIASIENEQVDMFKETLECQHNLDQSSIIDTSADDSVFNDRITQIEEIIIDKKNKLRGLQSIWDDIYESFNCLVRPYSIGDSVLIQGKLYFYNNANQIYVNNIRPVDLSEEIMMLAIKLEDNFEPKKVQTQTRDQMNTEKRASGLMTFDNIPSLNTKISVSRNIEVPESNDDVLNLTPEIYIPHSDATITFDTFTGQK